jgi:mannose-1-phosphate guanylyltransferase
MNAVILVGGFGTRLRPLTLTVPKQMLPVAGATMIERVVEHLAAHGVDRAVLALGYRPDVFRRAFPDGRCHGVELVYAVEPEPLDTGGAVGFAARAAGIDDTFIVVNGDVLTDLDVSELVAAHRESGAEGTIALTPVDDPSRYGVVPIDVHGRVTAFIEKPPPGEAPSNWINAGTYVLEPSVLDRIEPDRKVSIEREVFPAMVADLSLFALEREGRWIDAGTPSAYIDASLAYIDGTAGAEPPIAADAKVSATATVERSWVGGGAVVGAGAVVEDSLVLPGAWIGEGAVVHHSIIGPRAFVGTGAKIDALSVVGEGAQVQAGAVLSDARVPPESE